MRTFIFMQGGGCISNEGAAWLAYPTDTTVHTFPKELETEEQLVVVGLPRDVGDTANGLFVVVIDKTRERLAVEEAGPDDPARDYWEPRMGGRLTLLRAVPL